MFKRRVTWSGWQLAVYKWSTTSIALIIGCYFADIVRSLTWLLALVAVITTPLVMKWWFSRDYDVDL
ncbi:MAG: hypothetical protein AB7W16_08150 [Candidatus Obscuribacterales bacterium]